MTTDEKLAAILAAVQTDPGNRGLARDPDDNFFTVTAGQFQAACRSIAEHPSPVVAIFTGFWIPSATPPAFETDGPLGVITLESALGSVCISARTYAESGIIGTRGVTSVGATQSTVTHLITCERPGPTRDGTFRTMRGLDITAVHQAVHLEYVEIRNRDNPVTIGIGDGGNEIGMGSISLETMAKNIPQAEQVRCVMTCDHLIVAGVSNWGAYALAAGVNVLRRGPLWYEMYVSKYERATLERIVQFHQLVDGVTGRQEATVDGLPWDVYAAPLQRIREILELP